MLRTREKSSEQGIRGVQREAIAPLLVVYLEEAREEWGERLVAAVVYGSYARGQATPSSDIDLLLVVEGLPHDWRLIHDLEEEWARRGRAWGKRWQVLLASPEDVNCSVEWAAPLMLEIYEAHWIVFDPQGFFADRMRRMKRLMEERGIRQRRPGVWEVPEYASP
jgi:hypothetical protein